MLNITLVPRNAGKPSRLRIASWSGILITAFRAYSLLHNSLSHAGQLDPGVLKCTIAIAGVDPQSQQALGVRPYEATSGHLRPRLGRQASRQLNMELACSVRVCLAARPFSWWHLAGQN